jgi:HAD superfamily hydrolase (TIGR01509 family)
MNRSGPGKGVLFDVDGTLVDTNYCHVIAWFEAFRHHGYVVSMTDIHRTVGQGSDQLIQTLVDTDDEGVRRAHSSFYRPWLERVQPFPGAADLLHATAERGLQVVLATSSAADEAEILREAIGADDVVSVATTKSDVEASKPAPDLVQAALDKSGLGADDVVFVGDTVWDVQAAGKAGVECIAVLTGGISESEVREAGAVAVYRDVRHLLDDLDDSAIGELARRT